MFYCHTKLKLVERRSELGLHLRTPKRISLKLEEFVKNLNNHEKVFWKELVKKIHNIDLKQNQKFPDSEVYRIEHKLDLAIFLKKFNQPREAWFAALFHNETTEALQEKLNKINIPEYFPEEKQFAMHGEKPSALLDKNKIMEIHRDYQFFMSEVTGLLKMLEPKQHDLFSKVICEKYLKAGKEYLMMMGIADKLSAVRLLPKESIRNQITQLLFYGNLAKNLNRYLRMNHKKLVDFSTELRSAYTKHLHPKIHEHIAGLFKQRFKFKYDYANQVRISNYWGQKIFLMVKQWAKKYPQKNQIWMTRRIKSTDSIEKKLRDEHKKNGKNDVENFKEINDFQGFTVAVPNKLGQKQSKPELLVDLAQYLIGQLTAKSFLENNGMKRIKVKVTDWKDRLHKDSNRRFDRMGQRKKDERLLIHFEVTERTVNKDRSYAFEIIIENEDDFSRHEYGDASHDIYKNDNKPLASNYILAEDRSNPHAPKMTIVTLPEKATYEHIFHELLKQNQSVIAGQPANLRPEIHEAIFDPDKGLVKKEKKRFALENWNNKVLQGEYVILQFTKEGHYPLYLLNMAQQTENPKELEIRNLETKKNLEKKRKLIRHLNRNRRL